MQNRALRVTPSGLFTAMSVKEYSDFPGLDSDACE